ncbi:2-oxo acid dehydrogenase subunit E2 [bacterium]|nr:2-oxo acid dehydrogenase subunit E2 [bacterium]
MAERQDSEASTVIPFSLLRRQQVDWLELMSRKHVIHALLEFDVAHARQTLKERLREDGAAVSFTAFLVWCVARAVDADKRMHAYRAGRARLVLFEDVDITVLVEREVDGQRVPVPYIVRAANRKDAAAISAEIRNAQTDPAPRDRTLRWLPLWLWLPAWLRRLVLSAVLSNPYRRKRLMGTVAVSAVGMFGRGRGWGLPLTAFTLCITSGGISRDGDRELLALTLSVDHDVIDGAPAARFAERLRKLVEAGLPG